jgi:methyl-accepting chemotaxis protein
MFKNMKIGTKLFVAFLGIALIFSIAGTVSLLESRNALSKAAFNQLESVRENKKARVEDYFAERESDMHVLLETVALFRQNAFQRLQAVRDSKKFQLEQYFQERLHNVTLTSQSVSISQALHQFEEAIHIENQTSRQKTWQSIEKKFDIELKQFKKKHGYHNLFLIAKDGHIVYSASQSVVVGKNVLSPELKNTPLNRAFQKGLKEIAIQDFAPCLLSDENPQVIFLAAPVFLSGKLVGVLLLCLTAEQINAITQKRQGLGQTGEAYLVGALNGKTVYRSDKMVNGKSQPVIGTETSSKDINKALAGQSGTEIKMGSTGTVEITSYAPLQIPGLNWAIITTIGLEESLTPTRQGEQEAFFAKYIAQYGYYDLFLIHPQGHIFYTAKHEADYNTNILAGKYANSGLGKLVQEVLKTKAFGITDYAPYAPSNDEPAAFSAQPLLHKGTVEIVVAVQLSDVELSKIMLQRAGMGKTGEAYLVGSDKLMRSNSFLDPVNRSIKASFANPTTGAVDTEASRAALAGETRTQMIKDYRNTSVLSAYTPVKVGNTTWALLVEIDKAEAFAALTKVEWSLGMTALLSLVIIIGIAWLLTRSIKHPLAHLVDISKAIAAGNLNNDIKVTGKDEMGQLLQAFADMQTQLREHLEKEINNVIYAISQGNFEERISLENKTGFFKTLSNSINQIVEFNQNIIEDIMRLLSALAQGDLSQTIENNNYVGAFEQLKEDANATVSRLTEIMTEISRSAGIVATATEEISQGNMSLSQRTEQQAASLEETAASMEQMTSTVQQSADNAKEATQLALSAKERAEKGGDVVGATINAMTEISNSSKKVADIIGVIDEIAFQTNLLALNAAVEAARAGDQGRGFAVVASEVRNLAQRSAAAAKEIKELIQDSVAKVEEGTGLANQSGETLEEIVTATKKVNDIIAEIAAASQEQSSGINQVNKAVTQMDEMTQQNAALVEEAASASESMKDQAQSLKQQVTFFNLGQEISPPPKKRKKKNAPQNRSPLPLYHHNADDDGWEDF